MDYPNDFLNEYSVIIGALIGVITVLTSVVALFRYKWNQALKGEKFKLITKTDIDKLTDRIDDLCTKLERIRKQMESEIISAKEEHAEMQIKYQELVKELYKLIGQVTALLNKHD